MPTLEAIGAALATVIGTLDGIRVQEEFGTAPNVSGNALVAVVEYDGTVYDQAFNGTATDVTYKVSVLGGQGSERATRKKLLALADPSPGSATSLAAAVNGSSLGNVVSGCRVVSNTGLMDFNLAGGEAAPTYPGIEFTLAVMPS
jgi:hypothetical protein